MNKKYFQLLIFPIVFIFTLIIGCSTDEDSQSPLITVVSPAVNSVFENGDTIRFRAYYSDNSQLISASIQMVDSDNKPVLGAISSIPVSNPFTFEGEYAINDPLLPGGVYNLRFTTSDGVNTTNHFTKIQVHEIERKLLYPVIVTQKATNTWQAYRMLPDETWYEFTTHSGDYCGSAINPLTSQFYFCGRYQSDLVATKLPDGIPVWRVKPVFNQAQRWFEGIVFDQSLLYIASYEGNIRGYDKTGTELYKSETFPNEYPKLSVLTKNFIIGAFIDDFSSNKHLVVFHNQGGKMIYSRFFQKNVVELLHTSGDKVLVFSNSNGIGDISIYNGADNILSSLHSVSSGSIHEVAAMDNDNYIISTSAGLFRYQLSNNSLTPFAENYFNCEIACDPVSQQVFASSKQQINVFNFPFAVLTKSYSTPYEVTELHLMYNK